MTFVRLGALVVLFTLLQISGIGDLRAFGGSPDLLPLLVGAVALYAGALSGALAGFCIGLLVDLLVGPDVGATALVLTGVGYGVGRYCEVRDPAHSLAPIPAAAAATAAYEVGMAGISFVLEVEAAVSVLVLREAAIGVLLNVLIALPVFAFVRRVMRPALLFDPLERRRRRRSPRASGPLGLRGLEAPGASGLRPGTGRVDLGA